MVRSVFLPVVFLAATGCSAVVTGAPSEDTDAQSTSVTGVVVVDRTVSGNEIIRGEASARFVKLRGPIDDGALRLASAGLDVPPIGECGTVQDRASSRSVELLDVGAVSLESASHVLLAPRQVPDVVDLVSGTMYSARIDEATVPSGADVTVLVAGSADVPAFSVRATAPDAPSSVRLTGLDGALAELSWNAASTNGARDAIWVDLGTSRCSFADDGHAVIASASFGDEGTLVVHRVRREKLSIPGLDGGELRFDFARTIAYRR